MDDKGWIFAGVATVITAVGIPKIIEAWRAWRETKFSVIQNQLDSERILRASIEKDYQATKERLREIQIISSAVIPQLRMLNEDDKKTLQLIDWLEDNTNFNVTPSET